ncbi:outer membrane protein, OMP85 family, putative [Candidatus Vecturithrix granuli]|uniref:Outer membrane protein assembly factor BamA n=1 Tax=Vecturithrix granuli TaxID=1499967 RepID=A0A081BX11_VECG1|nr:outer membrane protein, OMP85 family, putative [Candidatus Vecturithrix granuli]
MNAKIFFSFCCCFLACALGVEAGPYDGLTVQEVEVTCTSSEELARLVRRQIVIEPGDLFSQEKIRESIHKIYAMKRFVQITVEAEQIANGVRLTFCPRQIDTISRIQVAGNKAISAERIKNVLSINIGDQVPPNGMAVLKQRLLQLYRDQGYHQVQIEITAVDDPGFDKKILMIAIQEGVPSKIGSLSFKGQMILSEKELIAFSTLRTGMHFTLDTLEKAKEQIEQAYMKKGYFEAKIASQDMTYNYDTGEVNLVFTIVEGQPLTIRFEGNAQIKTKALHKLINIGEFGRGTLEEFLAENVSKLTEYYRSRGYYFADISSDYAVEGTTPMITFSIEEGHQVRVERITIEGHRAFTTRQLRKLMLTDTGGWFSKGVYQEKVFKEDLLAIKAFYQQHGYLIAEIVSTTIEFNQEQNQVTLHLQIQEGVQTRVEEIHIIGEEDETFLKNLQKKLALREQDPLDLDKLVQTIERFQEFYANKGYIKADIKDFRSFNEDQSRVILTLKIDRGIQFFVGKISIQGIIRTKKEFIMRELQVQEGDVYNPQKIRETVRRLLQLGFYDSVTFQILDPKSTNPVQDMLLVVKETSAKDVEFGFGYNTETYFKGFVEYSDKNVLNYGGKATARLDASIERPKVTLQYRHPHFFMRDNDLVLSVFDDIQKDNNSFEIERRGGRLAFQKKFSESFSTSVGYFFEIEDPSNVKKDAVLSKQDTSIINVAGFDVQASWDTRDDLIIPQKGGYLQVGLRSALEAVGAETEFLELYGQSYVYWELFDNVILANALKGRQIEPIRSSDQTPIYMRYFLGGDGSVRGFERHEVGPTGSEGNKIGGDRMFAFTTELRFPIYSILGGVVFFDAGANWLNDQGFESDDLRETLGAGLRIATPIGPLRVDYGYKLDRRSGESAGEYYIAIGSTF